MDGETVAVWGVISRFSRGQIYVMFGPVISIEAHLAFSGARPHSNNTAEITAMIEAFSFLGPRGPVTHDERSRIFDDSIHAAGICLGTIQARTHVQLAFACQQSVIRVQHRLRFTMQHVCSHGGNLGNECADHAAALGTYGLISGHNVTSRWIRHTFDTDGCFNRRHNISETLDRLQDIRTNTAISPGQGLALALLIVFFMFSAFLTYALVMGLTCSQPFVLLSLIHCFPNK